MIKCCHGLSLGDPYRLTHPSRSKLWAQARTTRRHLTKSTVGQSWASSTPRQAGLETHEAVKDEVRVEWVKSRNYQLTAQDPLGRRSMASSKDMYMYIRVPRERRDKVPRAELLLLDLITRLQHVIYMSSLAPSIAVFTTVPCCIVEPETTMTSIKQPPAAANATREGQGPLKHSSQPHSYTSAHQTNHWFICGQNQHQPPKTVATPRRDQHRQNNPCSR